MMADETPAAPETPLPNSSALEVGPWRGLSVVHYSQRQAQRARDVLARLYALQRIVRFYPFEHPAVRETILQFESGAQAFHDEGVELQLVFFQGEILLGDQFLAEESVIFAKLVDEMDAAGIGSLSVSPGVTTDEIARAARILAATPTEIAQAGGVVRMAESAHLPHIRIGVVMAAQYDAVPGSDEERAFLAFANAVDLIEEIDESLDQGRGIDPTRVRGAVQSLVDGILTNRNSMFQLTALKNVDKYTFYHSANVAILSIALGSALSHDERFLTVLGTGALLHDIGKLRVGKEMLNKPGQLTPAEWEAMRAHPTAGAQMVSFMHGIDKAALVPILEHHMRWDGRGYPARQPPGRQHITSRVVAIADSYDAMTSRRAYSAARTRDDAISHIVQGAGTSFDPVLVRVFVSVLGVYPPRSVVRLSSGEVGIVVAPADNEPLRPVVRVITAPDGVLIDPVDIALVGREDLSIVVSLDPRLLNISADDYF